MTSFEFILMMVSVVLSLGLAQLLTGYVRLIQEAERVRFCGVHALWCLVAFLSHLDFWLSLWTVRDRQTWGLVWILLIFLGVVTLYVLSVMVLPRMKEEGAIDLPEFHRTQRKRYLGVLLVYMVIGLFSNLTLMSETFSLWAVVGMVPMMLPVALAILVERRWVQWACVLVFNASMAVYFVTFFAEVR